MCGIAGIASTDGDVSEDLVVRMRDTMSHRGPDDAGVWRSADGHVALAQRRLAIIDLSPGGHQPMGEPSGRYWITFNGELYNYQDLRRELIDRGHQFRTASDTEVILEAYRAWGVECLPHLNGMFAFALYDVPERRLLIARDRAGEKPLFFRHAGGRLAFASELKGLMADPAFHRTLDRSALEYYLAYGYVSGDRTLLQGARKLGQGSALTYDVHTDSLRTSRYWTLPSSPQSAEASAEACAAELETLLEDSVRRQLVADVPVGILLSGGIDSSLVTAMAARVSSRPVKTFTITFPGHSVYDEAAHAQMVARHFGTHHTELAAEPATVELLPTLARQYDEPIGDSSIVPAYLVSRLVRAHATVALGGDGGDELFGGYPQYSWIQKLAGARRVIPRPLRQAIGAAAGALPVGLRGRNYLMGALADVPEWIAHVGIYFDHTTRRRLLSPAGGHHATDPLTPEAYRASLCASGASLVRQASEADFRTTLVDDYLVKTDRASMLNSLELRAPFLDHRLIEFAFGRVPDSLKATKTERKILLARLATKLLPAGFDVKRKQGFSIPLASWFKGAWGTYVEAVLREADPALFNPRTIQALIAGQRRGYANTSRLFALTMFELWRREYHVAVST